MASPYLPESEVSLTESNNITLVQALLVTVM
ncbi:hypothetical protein EYZ11_013123 [Aspergillus tanneri]|uniref:Uncharacterized protein n=1 Tax=Aspergillus tanneri TaxID=1220188 RepID=A0A4S3IYG1_9EURO|nr:hypothetical protein EYZ11_013123 [Aspergillus tanneri]